MQYLSFSLGFSAGVMVYISFMELMPSAIKNVGELWGVIAFFIGIGFIGLIDILIPKIKNPHHFIETSTTAKNQVDKPLLRTGLFTALAIGIHNLPEGLATFGTTLTDIRLGAIIAIAIAIHNIPEGIAVSMPIYYATKNKNKAFVVSFLSGIAEPIGALIGFLILLPFLSVNLLASLLAFTAGVMVYISIDEILPVAHRYAHGHTVISGLVLGMLIMALSLFLL
jgi:ZIP family zinc transporter